MIKALAMTDGPLCMPALVQLENLNLMLKENRDACILRPSVVKPELYVPELPIILLLFARFMVCHGLLSLSVTTRSYRHAAVSQFGD